MMRHLAIAAAAVGFMAVAAPAIAQDVRIGPSGVTIGAEDRPSWRERQERREWRERRADRVDSERWRRDRDIDRTGSVGCRTVSVETRRPNGDIVTRRTRQCD